MKYVAAYLATICHRWKKAGITIDDAIEIIATLYSVGVVECGKEKRAPHVNPVANRFGTTAKELFLSSYWREECSEK